MFIEQVIGPMIEHVEQYIKTVNKKPDKNGQIKNTKYICISGGLVCSDYFQMRINKQFGIQSKYKLSIRMPLRWCIKIRFKTKLYFNKKIKYCC